jgi:hypothetical protein
MVHEDRSVVSYDSFYCCFRTAQAPKILAGSGALPSETKIQLEKNNTSQLNLFLKKAIQKRLAVAHRRGGALVARNAIWKFAGSALRTGLRLGLGSNCPAATSRGKDKAKLYFTVLMFSQHWPSRTNKSPGKVFPWRKPAIVCFRHVERSSVPGGTKQLV